MTAGAYLDPDDGPLDDVDDKRPSLHLRKAEAARWLDVVFGDRRGYVAMAWGLDPFRNAEGRYEHRRWVERSYAWPASRDELLGEVAELLAAADDGNLSVDVYVTPHLRTSRGRRGPTNPKGSNALPPTLLHADMDGPAADGELYDLLASLRTASGTDGHEHGIVLLDAPLDDRARWVQCQRALRDRLGGGVDDKIADNDLLRLPGTVNAKPTVPASGPTGPPLPVAPIGWTGRVWSLAELADVLGVDLDQPAPPLPVAAGGTADAPETVPAPTNLPDRLRRAVDGFTEAPNKSNAWQQLVSLAVVFGYGRDESFALVVEHALPHIGRFAPRALVEFDRSWAKAQAYQAQRPDRDRRRPALSPVSDGTAAAAESIGERAEPLALDDARAVVIAPSERAPADLLAGLLAFLRTWLLMPDVVPLVAALAVAVGARDGEGDPAWLLLISDPSSGKTEIIRLFDAVAEARLDDVTVAGLLSWSKGRKPHPVGVLTRIRRGLLTLGDLSTLLAGSDHGGRDAVYALLRRVADGEVVRDVAAPSGAAVPGSLSWSGRIHIIGGATSVIDRYANHTAALGDRWLSCRPHPMTRAQSREAARMCRARDLPEHRAHGAKLVAELVATARTRLDNDADLSEPLAALIEDAAQVTAWGRASVPRAAYGRREVEGVATVEAPMRLVRQLDVVARGVLALGLSEQDAAVVVRRLAVDSMPAQRAGVLRALAGCSEPVSTAQVARLAGEAPGARPLHWNVTARALEELSTVGVVDAIVLGGDGSEGPDAPATESGTAADGRVSTRWRLADADAEVVRDVMTGLTCMDLSHEAGAAPS
ncbi:hypothetical protein SAMN05216207_104634 [Pseudonocardia ammonioxydans]|uniref:Uncharacterized protein n=1 Tax=Pseudonocardia ammonioxydans TaxID=260086 RepID=A0A1I5GH29_PSUAM|nr:hypothetical protein [Pseudonocardia ammonioxydans]SFO34881.1 hypothetical protein SAMN05216207_104634 [Pseudonocardia ammonioxydans]